MQVVGLIRLCISVVACRDIDCYLDELMVIDL
jgi:hypothetical protein